MSCNNLKTAEAKTKSWLRTLGVIDKYLNIINLNKFRTNVTELSNYSKEKYGITERLFFEKNQGRKAIPNTKVFHQIDAKNDVWYTDNLHLKNKNTNYQVFSNEGIIASEKTIRDLAARMSDRIGIPVRFESDRTKKYKGKLEDGTAVINLAYATLDTVPHEVLSHPIIRALKNKSEKSVNSEIDKMIEMGVIKKEC